MRKYNVSSSGSLSRMIPQGSTDQLMQRSSSGKRRTRFADEEPPQQQQTGEQKETALAKSRDMRNKIVRELSRSLEQRKSSIERISKILQVKRAFQQKFENLRLRIWNNRAMVLKRLGLAILKAYSEKNRDDRRDQQVISIVQGKLKEFKLRRLFSYIHHYKEWQKTWLRNVQQNFVKQRKKNLFRDIYLNALMAKFNVTKDKRLKTKAFKQIIEECNLMRQIHRNLLRQGKIKITSKVFQFLKNNKIREQDLMKKRLKIQRRRSHFLYLMAMQNWKLYTKKMKEFQDDPITRKFVDYDNAIFRTDKPGQPLEVMESDDSCLYFDVNAKYLNFCEYRGNYEEKDYQGDLRAQGSIIKNLVTTNINLDKYNEEQEPVVPQNDDEDY